VKAYILAGGSGSRLSPDKGFYEVGGVTLLDRACLAAAPLVSDIVLVGSSPRLCGTGLRIISEETPGSGPLAAVLAALCDVGCEDALILPWDAPFITTDVLRYLRQAKGSADAVVPRRGDEVEPLFAIYGPGCLEAARHAFCGGQRRVVSFYDEVRVRWVGPGELERFGLWDKLFLNINTEKDLLAARGWAVLEGADDFVS
jgi:molybdenum cofactor guanylyltransferase